MPAPPEIDSPPSTTAPEGPFKFDKPDKTGEPSPVQLETDLSVAANFPISNNPCTAGAFLGDLEIIDCTAPANPEQVGIIPLEGADRYGHNLLGKIQQSHDGSRYNGERVAEAVARMSAVDAYRYKNEPAYRSQIQTTVSSLDAPVRNYVNSLLNQVSDTGQPPRIGTVEKIFANVMNGGDVTIAMPYIENLLGGNPELRQRLSMADARLSPQERALKETIDGTVNRALFETYGAQFGPRGDAVAAERSAALKSLWDYGYFPSNIRRH